MDRNRGRRLRLALVSAAVLVCGVATAQTMYKYRGPDGDWIYADRPPDDGRAAQSLGIDSRASLPVASVTHRFTGSGFEFIARNTFFAPVEIALEFDDITGLEYPHPDHDRLWVLSS